MLSDLYPEASHVRDYALERADDDVIWNFARQGDFVIVSKDADFHERSFLFGFPPKVIWLRMGNCSTKDLEKILRGHNVTISQFFEDSGASFLILP